MLRDQTLRDEFPLLCRAAAETGGVATQNRGTIGGNIANASPAADTPPALLVYDAELELASVRGRAGVPYERVSHRLQEDGPRAGRTDRARSACRERARLDAALPQGRHAPRAGDLEGVLRRARADGWRRACRRAHRARQRGADGGARDEDRSSSPISSLDPATLDKALQALDAELAPIDDLRSTATNRRRVAANLMIEFVDRLRAA